MQELIQIRQRLDHDLRNTAAVQKALSFTFDQPAYVRYLSCIANQYAIHSPKVMCLAAARLMDCHPELAIYLLKHASEERGHNEWAVSDLMDLSAPEDVICSAVALPGCAAMIAMEYYVAMIDNPVGLYGWMYVLEGVGADLGGDVGSALKSVFNHAARFVAGHGVADVGHVDEIYEQITAHVKAKNDVDAVVRVAELSAVFYLQMINEIEKAS